MKVSILCTTYNHEKYIRHTLESFLMQKTNFKYEILIHDDASTDNTAAIIKEYEEKYPEVIQPIYQKENQYSRGISISSTYLYPKAKGEYIAFCEGDDYWIDENKLQIQVDWLDKHPEDIGCVHKYIVVDEDEKVQDIKTFGYYDGEDRYTLKDFQEKELPSQLASLVCRNIFTDSQNGYPKGLNNIQLQGDIKIYLYLLMHGSIYRFQQVLSAYRFVYYVGGNSWSSRTINSVKGYNDWLALKQLEKFAFDKYHLHISLYERKKVAAFRTVVDFFRHVSINNFINAIKVIALQRGCLRFALIKMKKKINA